MTQQIPRFPPNPNGTAPLYPADELQAIMDRRPEVPPVRGHLRRGNPWLLRALVLVGVAVFSGLVWWMLAPSDDGSPGTATPSTAAGKYAFETDGDPVKDSDCASHAYGETKTFLTGRPCQQLTRAMYTATMSDGRTVYTSVSVVRMKTVEDAVQLKALTERNGTGNVNDLVKEKVATVPGLDTLANGGYASEQRDRDVVIVESDTKDRAGDASSHVAEMKRVSADALRLAKQMG